MPISAIVAGYAVAVVTAGFTPASLSPCLSRAGHSSIIHNAKINPQSGRSIVECGGLPPSFTTATPLPKLSSPRTKLPRLRLSRELVIRVDVVKGGGKPPHSKQRRAFAAEATSPVRAAFLPIIKN
jgi:hypothetical protein